VRARQDREPNEPDVLLHEGYVLGCTGAPETGLERVVEAMALNPFHPAWYHYIAGSVAFDADQPKAAAAEFTRCIDGQPGPPSSVKAVALRNRAAANMRAGHIEAGRRDAAAYIAANPGFRPSSYRRVMPRKDQAVIERDVTALEQAGLPV
jgi:adenylate cyclase